MKQGYGEYLLLHYREISAHVSLLEQELATYRSVSEEEVIEAMSLRRSGGGRGNWGKDNTGSVALVYQEATRRLNEVTCHEIQLELEVGRGELERLRRGVAALPDKQSRVLEGLYLRGLTGSVLCDALEISPRSLYRYRKMGIEALNVLLGGRYR